MIIVTRHAGAIEWLRRKGITGEIVIHATPSVIRDQVVVGILPFHLAALTKRLMLIDVPRIPKELRGTDLTPEQMDMYGATIREYKVMDLTRSKNNESEEKQNRASNRDFPRSRPKRVQDAFRGSESDLEGKD